ncbi:hypothetical protein [Bauldia litoralis]|uniref:hypothetical protein n=1 Tax=Bauldia litoralis TaxID=665467 RepID=UPI0032639957
MQINPRFLDDFPRQAWLIRGRGRTLDVALGRNVALFEHGFFEGGWARTPGPEALRPEGIHLGSGAVWGDGRLTLIAPSHSLESVWTAETDGAVWAANSLALLVAATRPADFAIWRRRTVLRTIHRGLSAYRREVFATPEVRICRFANAFVTLAPDAAPADRAQCQEATFDSFETYVAFLRDTTAEAMASYGKPASVYLSRGYDSPATAVLARQIGPATAICLDQTAKGNDDDGTAIAERLGMPVVSATRRKRATRTVRAGPWDLALETIAPDDHATTFEFFNGTDISEESMLVPDEVVADRAILTGWFGDAIWGFEHPPSPDLQRSTNLAAGTGLADFRLRTGFMHVPIPALGFNRAAAIRAIGLSDAMKPWRLGTDYDRPIPRRLVEEAGIPRSWFGMAKQFTATKAANLHEIAPLLFDRLVDRYAPAMETGDLVRRPAELA